MQYKKHFSTEIDGYLQAVPETIRSTLENVRQAIKAAVPHQAEEIISYLMPTYKYLGPLVYFAALKKHLSLYVASKKVIEQLRTELQAYKTGGIKP